MENINNEMVNLKGIELSEIERLEKEKLIQFNICNAIIAGTITETKEKSISFDERKKNIEEKIKNLRQQGQNSSDDEIQELEQQYQSIAAEQEYIKNKYNSEANQLLFEISKIRKQKLELQNQSNIDIVEENVTTTDEEPEIKEETPAYAMETNEQAIEIETNPISEETKVEIETAPIINEEELLNEYIKAHNELENVALSPREGVGSYTTPEELVARQQYMQARNSQDTESIINAIESAKNLPDDSVIKPALINAISKLNDRFISIRTEEEKEKINIAFGKTEQEIELTTNNNIEPKEEIQEETIAEVETPQVINEEELLNEYIKAHNELEKIALSPREGMGSYTTPEELTSRQVYMQARNLQDTESIVNAIESAKNLPDSSIIKPALINAITKLNDRFINERTEEEKEKLNIAFGTIEQEIESTPITDPEITEEKEEIKVEETKTPSAYDLYIEADNKLRDVTKKIEVFNNEQRNLIDLYSNAVQEPTIENITTVLENVNNLPDTDVLKQPLIEAITAVKNRFFNAEEKEEIKEVGPSAHELYELYIEADNKLRDVTRTIETFNNEQRNLIDLYSNAVEEPSIENITIVLENANKLPDTDKLKQPLIEAITAVKNRFFNTNNDDKNGNDIDNDTQEFVEDPWILPMNTQVELPTGMEHVQEETIISNEEQQNINDNIPSENQQDTPLEKQEDIVSENKEDIPLVNQQDIPPVIETFEVPKVIKSVKQASNKLLQKVHSIDFKNLKDKALDWMREHTIATLIGAAAFLALGATLHSASKEGEDINIGGLATGAVIGATGTIIGKKIKDKKEQENEVEKEFINETIIPVPEENNIEEKETTTLENLRGKDFYDNENKILTETEAHSIIENGGQVTIAGYDEFGNPKGYIAIQPTNENSGMTR